MRTRRLLWNVSSILVIGSAASCEQSYDEGLRMICESPIESGGEAEQAEDSAKAATASRWVASHVENAEARALFVGLAPLGPEEKAARVREAAAEIGLAGDCPIADLWEAGGAGFASRTHGRPAQKVVAAH